MGNNFGPNSIHIIWVYDDCNCDWNNPPSPSSAVLSLGASTTAAFTLVSKTPGITPWAWDACNLAWHTTSTVPTAGVVTSSVKSAEGYTSTFGTSDANLVGIHAYSFAWAAERTPSVEQGTISYTVEVQPDCSVSPIIFETFLLPVTPDREVTTSFSIPESDLSHTYQGIWAAAGYPNACTLGLSLSGSAAAYSTLDGFTVEITPPADAEIGITDLHITATYTAVQFGTVPTADVASAVQSTTIVVSRADYIETWKIYIIAGLGVANLLFAVITVFMFSKRPISYTEVHAKMPRTIDKLRRKADIDLIILD